MRNAWTLFSVLPKADRTLAAGWWLVLVLRGVLPAVFAVATGVLVGAVQRGDSLTGPLAATGAVFILLQVLSPIHQALSANLGDRTAAWLYDRLTETCVRPPGMGHLEDPALTSDLTVARDFDLGMTGPPLAISMDFIASGMVEMLGGLAAAALLFAYAWWAPIVLGGAWLATHWLLRESAVWFDRNTDVVRSAQRDAEYTYRLAVDPAPAKELRLFGLAGWTIDRFVARRTLLHTLQYEATRLREKPLLWSLLLVTAANVVVFWSLASAAARRPDQPWRSRRLRPGGDRRVDDRLRRVQLGARRRGGAGGRGASPRRDDGGPPARSARARRPAAGLPAREIRFRDVTFAYPGGEPVLEHFDLTIPAGSSIAIVGQNGAGQDDARETALPPVRPAGRRHRDRRRRSARPGSRRVARARHGGVPGLHPLRAAPARQRRADRERRTAAIAAALASAGADKLAGLDTVLARGYDGGTDLSGGQWQRVALARALCAVRTGAGLVLLDEPTAQLDVRGEAEIFDRILAATRHATTILISHRFSTVRHADRICVLEQGRVIELGTHDELMARGGRYQAMFDLQAQRFNAAEDEEGQRYDVLA